MINMSRVKDFIIHNVSINGWNPSHPSKVKLGPKSTGVYRL